MIEFTRGDTLAFKFKINYKNGESVKIEDIEDLVLTCRKFNFKESPILFDKSKDDFRFEKDYYHCVFMPEDTRELEYGKYNFDIQVTLKGGFIKTLKSEFTITEEDTIYTEKEV